MLFSENQLSKIVLGVNIDDLSDDAMRTLFHTWITGGGYKSIVTPNPEFILLAEEQPHMKNMINTTDLRLPDGIGLQYASIALSGIPIQYRHTGIDSIFILLELANNARRHVLLVGTNSLETLLQAKEKLSQQFSQTTFSAIQPGVLHHSACSEEIVSDIIQKQSHIILLALPMQAQLQVIQQLKQAGFDGIIMGVGGALDMISGSLKRAPVLWQKWGIEWLWRFFVEPMRYKRIYRAVIIFPYHVACVTLKQGYFVKACLRLIKYFVKI